MDEKIADMQNFMLQQGFPVEVYPTDLHATHAQSHIPALQQIIDGVEQGTIDPMQSLPVIQAFLTHIAAHGEELAKDPTQRQLFGAVKEVVNNSQQILTNMERKIRAEQRKAAEMEGAGGTEQGGDNEQAFQFQMQQMKLQEQELKIQIIQMKAQLDAAGQQAKYQQALALNDAKAAAQAQTQMAYPATNYRERK
jgi:hypothetical protein